MRLLPILGRVKFRPGLSFRLHDPTFVEGRAPLAVGLATELYQEEDTDGHQEPPPGGEEPGDQAVAAPDRPLPRFLESVEREPGRGEHRGGEVLARSELSH